jgi:HJR/Mrr/RecB family endonuclease
MARRKKQLPTALLLLGILLTGYCVVQIVSALSRDVVLLVVLALLVIGAVILTTVYSVWNRNSSFRRVDTITDMHMDALVRQRAMQVRSDPYGKPILDKWHSEVSYFIAHHVRPNLDPNHQPLLDKECAAILQRISQRVANASQMRPAITAIPANITPFEFEAFCAERLRACGWDVQQTALSRDQGVDVIAEKSGVRVVLQCKLYSNPVGNKAVQEIAAGRVHQQAHHGAVVTNGTYTTSAKQLAATNGIRLLHHTDLPQLEQMVGITTTQ